MNILIEWDVYTVRYDSSNVGPSFLCQLTPGKDPIGVIGHRLVNTTLDGFLLGIDGAMPMMEGTFIEFYGVDISAQYHCRTELREDVDTITP